MKKILIIAIIIAFSSPVLASNSLKQIFTGVNEEISNNISERTKSSENEMPRFLTEEQVRSYQEQTIIEIKNSLAAYGYFKPTITPKINRNNTIWTITYFISTGNILRVTKLDLILKGEGISDKAFQELLRNFPINEGDVVRSKFYQEAKSHLVDLAAQRGYFAAKIERSNILINLEKNQATVIIHFNTGPRYYFGNIEFLPSPYSKEFLQRFTPFNQGSPFTNKKLIKFQENLGGSNFFQQVSVTPKPDQAKNLYVPIEVAIVPRKALQYNIGGGFGTDTGFRGMGNIQLRQVNTSGHHLEAGIQASQKTNHYEASYSVPGNNPVTDLYKLSAAVEQQHLSTSGKSRNEKVEASYIRTLLGWQQNLSLSLRDEHSVPTDDRPIINSTMLLPNVNWSKIISDNPLDPNSGYQININLRAASKSLISNTDFFQGLVQAKALYPVANTTRFVVKGQLGYTAISDINQLPMTLQFFTGGSQSVRGYQFQEIGPGRAFVLGSVELQQKLKGNLYGVVFTDAGSASNSFMDNLKKSIGIGLLWRSPIGAIEITLAEALDNPSHPKLLQFSMGPVL